jgi:hypothetical protein
MVNRRLGFSVIGLANCFPSANIGLFKTESDGWVINWEEKWA